MAPMRTMMVDAEEALSAQAASPGETGASAGLGPAGVQPLRPRRGWEPYSLLISLLAGLLLWWLIVVVTGLPKFILPTRTWGI